MRHTLLFIIASLPLTAMAQWTDVTDQMLQNPTFDNNSAEGWECVYSGASNLSYEVLETFNGTFRVWQNVQAAPQGTYRLSAQAYYRAGSDGDAYPLHKDGKEELTAYMFAGKNDQVALPCVYDFNSEVEGWGTGGWFYPDSKGGWEDWGRILTAYPTSMGTGAEMFEQGYYEVSLEFVHDGGDVEVGFANEHYHNSDWFMVDNVRLEYKGKLPEIPVQDFQCYDKDLKLMAGDTYTLHTYIYPATAAGRDIEWKSSDVKVATVSPAGVVKAVGDGKATITGKCAGKTVTVSVVVESIDETGKTWIDVTDEYMRQVDMTSGFDAWNRTPSRLDYDAAEFWNMSFDFYQEVELPEGYYRFSCQGFFRPTDGTQEAVNTQGSNTNIAYIYAGSRQELVQHIASEQFEEAYVSGFVWVRGEDGQNFALPNAMEAGRWCFDNGFYSDNHVVFHAVEGEKVNLGLRCEEYVRGQWCLFDNFMLEKLVKFVATQSLKISKDNTTLVVGETARLTVTTTPANATYQSFNWSSSDESVLTVDKDGNMTAVKAGTATVTAVAIDNEKIKASVKITVKDNEIAAGALVINEVMSMNVDRFLDPSFNYGGWIELYNPTDKAVSLRGCYITENPDNLTEHPLIDAKVVPAKGYYTIWFDHCDNYFPTQVDFKLGTGGDWVAVVTPNGEILAEVEYPAGVQRCSWARKSDGGSEWGYTAQPTPGETNSTSQWAEERLAAPEVDVQGHIFDGGEVMVKATWPKGATLRYTTDGTTPTATNGLTSKDGIFKIDNTTSLRLCAIQDGWLPSVVVTNTYISKEYDFTIPVLSVTASHEDLLGNDHGIFVRGNGNGRTGNGQSSKCNWNQDWDRPCTFEYYTPEGERTFMQDVDICAAGGWSRAWEPHSFKLKAAKVYGINSMDYPFFESKPFNKHKALQIRNGGNDNGCRFKDAALQTIIQRSGLYVDGQAYQPVVHYINGKFMGVINMREPNNKHHAYSNYGYDTDFLDQFEMSPDSGWICKNGDREAYERLIDLSEDAANPDTYQVICNELLDIDEYINYMACWMWLGNSDWMRNNVKAYRSTETDGKFHYVMFDTDGSFSYSGAGTFSRLDGWYHTTVGCDYIYELGYSLHVPFENVDIWFNLLQNDEFRKKFVDSYSLVCGSVFEPARCGEILDELYDRVQPMMQLNGSSAWGTYNDLKGKLTGNRSTNNIDGIASYYWFNDETRDACKVTVSSNIPQASILYNGMDVPTGKFTGTACLPVTLTAGAPGGYDFKGWMLKGEGNAGKYIFPKGSTWKYYDQGSLDGEDWTALAYDDKSWSIGEAPLGYDDGSSAQGVGGLLATNNLKKGTTFYFRRDFTLDSAPLESDSYVLDFILDDGCIVYVNGVEAGRDNMHPGEADYNTLAITYAANNPNRGSINIPAKLLKKGRNVIAVEVHNNSKTSSDICWDGGLKAIIAGSEENGDIISTNPVLDLGEIESGSELIAVYGLHEPEAGETVVPPVRINEVSAMNETFANEYYKRNDWIELYNTTGDEVDIAGMYITDNVEKPHKYQVPTQLESGVSTVIPAHGYMIVWCDKLTAVSQLHASFKLDGDADASVMLTAADDSWQDYLNYPAHDRDHTAGRYPDGSDNVYLMTTMTPGAANQMSAYATEYDLQHIPDAIVAPDADRHGTLGISFDGERIMTSRKARIEIYTAAGEVLVAVPSATAVSTTALRPGIYVARAKADGERAVVKFSR